MKKMKLMFNMIAVFVVCLFCSTLAQAQATRTWVSGVGDDANPCSRTAPCKTFAGAISKTAAGGEISVLDPGGFGAVNITKAITINGDGTLAGILASGGVNGVIVNAGVNDVVVLRNLSIHGAGTGLNGIRYLAGRHLRVENCQIQSFTNHGIDVNHGGTGAGELSVQNTSITNVNSVAVRVAATAGSPSASLDNVKIQRAGIGFDLINGTGTISNSIITQVAGQAVVVELAGVVNANNCTLFKNGFGLVAFTAGATLNFSNCDVYNNGTGLSIVAGATGNRFGNSRIFQNTTNENVVGTLNLGTNR
jgi:hypothetical protein